MIKPDAIRLIEDFMDLIEPDDRWIDSKTAANLLKCSQEKVIKMQNEGIFSLCFLPSLSEKKRRRFFVKEVYRVLAKRLIDRSFPEKVYKEGDIPF